MSRQLHQRALERRANSWEQYQSVIEQAESENRDLTAEEREQVDRLEEQIRSDSEDIRRFEQADRMETEFETVDRAGLVGNDAGEGRTTSEDVSYDDAFRAWVRGGMTRVPAEQRQVLQDGFDAELRAQGAGTDSAGGYTVPEGFRARIVETMQAFGGIRRIAEVLQTATGNNLPWPTNDDTGNKGAILDENTQVTEQDLTFGQGSLGAFMYTSRLVRVSLQLLQDSGIDIDGFIGRKLGERLGRATAEHYAVGTGTGQPQGAVSGADVGVTAAAADAVTYEELIDLIHSVDPAYRNQGNLNWVWNDQTLATIRKIKDNDNRPLWQPSVIVGQPDTFLGFTYVVDQDVPDMASENRSILFGDLAAGFVVRDVLGMQMMRLEERYADWLQVGFLAFLRTDSEVQDSDAYKALQQGV